MNNFLERMMAAGLNKKLARLVIFALCIALLGGGISVFLFRTQIGEAYDFVQATEENEQNDVSDGRSRKECETFELNDLDQVIFTEPSPAAKVTVGITALFGLLAAIAFWILVALWLYQEAICSGMNGVIWLLAGLCCNVLAALAFLLIRSICRSKCPGCGQWQPVKAKFCTHCGKALYQVCPECESLCKVDDRYCSFCGKALHHTET